MKSTKNSVLEKDPNEYNGELTLANSIEDNNDLYNRVEINKRKKLYIESYGCQMNFSDSEIVASILQKEGYFTTDIINDADLILVNTCSIREKAELTVRKRLSFFQSIKKNNKNLKVGVLG